MTFDRSEELKYARGTNLEARARRLCLGGQATRARARVRSPASSAVDARPARVPVRASATSARARCPSVGEHGAASRDRSVAAVTRLAAVPISASERSAVRTPRVSVTVYLCVDRGHRGEETKVG